MEKLQQQISQLLGSDNKARQIYHQKMTQENTQQKEKIRELENKVLSLKKKLQGQASQLSELTVEKENSRPNLLSKSTKPLAFSSSVHTSKSGLNTSSLKGKSLRLKKN